LGVPSGGVILAAGAVVWLVITWLYWALMESSSKQGTVGKDLLGIVVTDAEGNRMSFRKATVRHLGKLASALLVLAGFVMAGFTAKKQGLHDLITGSRVVMKQ
ncbi:MAG TPA: RDD family protein, partial [Dehalococcoidia bacterium]|nr:RDD family protein [Dehalococcoidia bacterium]